MTPIEDRRKILMKAESLRMKLARAKIFKDYNAAIEKIKRGDLAPHKKADAFHEANKHRKGAECFEYDLHWDIIERVSVAYKTLRKIEVARARRDRVSLNSKKESPWFI